MEGWFNFESIFLVNDYNSLIPLPILSVFGFTSSLVHETIETVPRASRMKASSIFFIVVFGLGLSLNTFNIALQTYGH